MEYVAMAKAIIVTGTPGVGKTAFSRKLAREIGAYYLSFNEYISDKHLYRRFDRKRGTKVVDVQRARRSLRSYLKKAHGLVVIDTNIPDVVDMKQTVKRVFVLRCHPLLLEKRLRRKGWRDTKVHENALAELLDSCTTDSLQYYGQQKVTQIDTSHTDLQQSIFKAKKVLTSKLQKRRPVMDWLRTLDKEGSLDQFLRR
jgi:adenylate kinase